MPPLVNSSPISPGSVDANRFMPGLVRFGPKVGDGVGETRVWRPPPHF